MKSRNVKKFGRVGVTMVDVFDIKNIFQSLLEYEEFHNEWAKACYKLNPTENNRQRLEHSNKVLAVMRKIRGEQE